MIQISSPIEAQSSIQENRIIENFSADFPLGWSQKAQKKNKPGLFAKLLDGLSAKVSHTGVNTKGAVSNGNSDISGVNPEKMGKNAIKAVSGAKKIPESGLFDVDPVSFMQEGQKGDKVSGMGSSRAAKKDSGSLSNNKVFPSNSENFPKSLNESLQLIKANHSGGNEEEIPGSASGARTGRAGKGVNSSALASNGDKTKNAGQGTANYLSFSFRELEAELLQSQLQKGQLKAENGEKDNSRLSEARGKKGKDRLNIEVRDLRTGDGRMENSGFRDALTVSKPGITQIELPVDLHSSSWKGDGSQTVKTGKETGMSFEDALARELRGNLSLDIVRDATVIVRNGGEGTIRLSLHPASLGDVKIRLEMTENKITGHIFVESNEALRAFERELPVLEKAFRDSGFSETNLEMSLSQDGGFFDTGEQRQEGDFRFLSPVQAASLYEAETDWLNASSESLSPVQGGISLTTQVNLLV